MINVQLSYIIHYISVYTIDTPLIYRPIYSDVYTIIWSIIQDYHYYPIITFLSILSNNQYQLITLSIMYQLERATLSNSDQFAATSSNITYPGPYNGPKYLALGAQG